MPRTGVLYNFMLMV